MAEVTVRNGDGRSGADDPPGTPRGRDARASAAGAVVVVAVLVAAWWTARGGGGGEPELTPGQVVSGFFQAQRDGDCRRLVDLVSDASWSDGGERSRAEFLDQCAVALDGYRPAVDALDLGDVDEDGDRIAVSLGSGSVPASELVEADDGPPQGSLVLEDGEWRVRLDDRVLRVGRSVPETVRAYLDAYNEADCERLVGLVSESAGPGGAGSRAQRVRRCEQDVEDGSGRGRPRALAASNIELSELEEDRAEVAVTVSAGGEVVRTESGGGEAETVRLVRDGLRWQLAGSDALPDGWDGAPLRAVAYAELEARMVDEVTDSQSACSTYADNLDGSSIEVDGAVVGVGRDFSGCHALVGVHRLAGGVEARRAARSLADTLADDPLPTARELDETEAEYGPIGRDQSLAHWQAYVDSLRPNQRAEVAGVPEAIGVRSRCDVEGCSSASAFAARGSLVVTVEMEAGDLDEAAGILRAQLERL